MPISEQQIDQAYSDLKGNVAGRKEDFFALVYLERELHLPREDAMVQIAFGGNDYGIDAFHLDPKRRNLYLFQFKWSPSHALFKGSMERLRDAGLERIFGNAKQDQNKNQLLLQLDSCLQNDKELVDRVFIHFVFNGEPSEAENSKVLESLREDLENKKYLLDQFFKRQVELLIEFRSAKTKKVVSLVHQKVTHSYPITMSQTISSKGPDDESMHIGFVRLMDLHAMYRAMNQRFFERNIRSALGTGEAPNRAILQSLKRIVLDCKDEPSVFAFNHNGVTISAQKLEVQPDSSFRITEPRLLNGAQTISTFDEFLKKNDGNALLKQNDERLHSLSVLAKIITDAKPEFVVSVTINNNRQNPVEPWGLRANDMIQLEMQDFFQRELNIYYERQENAFSNLTQEDLEELEIEEKKAIELLRLAKTLLASDGELDKFSRIREVFEQDKLYDEVFNKGRSMANAREIMLCYKIQFRINRLIREIVEKGERKYGYLHKARNLVWALLCQGVLNDDELPKQAERFGGTLTVEADYTGWLRSLASTRVRFLIGEVIQKDPNYSERIADERYDFLKSNAVYDKCMDLAYKKWRWVKRRLKS